MINTGVHELQTLLQILEMSKRDLNKLLHADHVPNDVSDKITKERKTISEIEVLLYDIRADLAFRDIKNMYMKLYTNGKFY